ncbi:hypothetical protein [Vulcanisaeta souniana]|uniref:Uncharacterized protein n=1 Tax=Vulcanisaeta souniana JCM 11219 TaxID=1293586 RepID=A0A830EJH3_9CREN|nr:hypothetical protein [Vulcanisaeta souniana]BDR92564.1 hypothetical protein Vsou_16570 [Vulcanisaeta souniana JCM 11219]GGI82900.1 hypothetical protein GCM10007112_19590 [Vulcanisaeta souniana JCM 11219]
MSIFTCDEVHWRLVELNIDHACGLASLVKIIGGRLGIFNIPNIIDVMVYNSYETVNHALGGSVVVERSLVPGLLSRAILIGSIPYASIEDVIVSVVVNRDLPWYIAIIRELMRNNNVRNNLRWEWINEVLNRFGFVRYFNEIISQ